MIAYKKQRRKVDPVKQILDRLEEKKSKSGLSLYSRTDLHEPRKEDALPTVKPFNAVASSSSKSSPFFPDLKAAQHKAHRRLNAGLRHSIDESDRQSALYAQAKAERRLNLTFPPVNSRQMSGAVNHARQGYAFSGWSDSPSSGVENLRNSHYSSMNPFGYSRRTLAFQPTSLNYVVEWPETWPLKIMSIGKGTGTRPHKKKAKPKPQNLRRVHFENSPAPHASPETQNNRNVKQASAASAAAPPQNQSNQVLPEMQTPLTSLSTDMTLTQSPTSEKLRQEKQDKQVPPRDEDVIENVTGYLLEVEIRNSAENPRVTSDTSSLSESAYVGTYEDKTSEIPDKTEHRQVDSVPPCTPTPTDLENLPNEDENQDSQERKGGVGQAESDSQSLLMGIVAEIAAEPRADFMRDI